MSLKALPLLSVAIGLGISISHAVYTNYFSGVEFFESPIRQSADSSGDVGPLLIGPEMNDIRIQLRIARPNTSGPITHTQSMRSANGNYFFSERRSLSSRTARPGSQAIVEMSYLQVPPIQRAGEYFYSIRFDRWNDEPYWPEQLSISVRRNVAQLNFPLFVGGLLLAAGGVVTALAHRDRG